MVTMLYMTLIMVPLMAMLLSMISMGILVLRVVDLAWDSPYTWLLTAVLVDLGYYWSGAPWAVFAREHFG